MPAFSFSRWIGVGLTIPERLVQGEEVPPVPTFLVTEAGDNLITEDGYFLVIE